MNQLVHLGEQSNASIAFYHACTRVSEEEKNVLTNLTGTFILNKQPIFLNL